MLNRFVNAKCSQLPSPTHLPQMKHILALLIASTLSFEATHIYLLLAWFLHVKRLGNPVRTFGQFSANFQLEKSYFELYQGFFNEENGEY